MLNWIVWNWTVYLYKMDLALNNLERLICHKTQTNKQDLSLYFCDNSNDNDGDEAMDIKSIFYDLFNLK